MEGRETTEGTTMAKLLWITNETLGGGDPELGKLLMEKYLYALVRADEVPGCIILMNAGVRLACEGSTVAADLQLLADRGVKVESCGTCLDFYQLREKLVVGEAGTMPATVDATMAADDVVVLR